VRFRRKIAAAIFSLVMTLVLTGSCLAQQVTLRAATWDGGQGLEIIKMVFQEFEKLNPDIRIEVESFSSYNDRMVLQFTTGNAPDIFMMSRDWQFIPFVEAGFVEPLNEYMERDGYDPTLIFYPAILSAHELDGKYYSLPKDMASAATYYNSELFAETGLPDPDPLWNWSDFVTAAQRLTRDRNGDGVPDQYGYYVNLLDVWATYPFIYSNGGGFLNPEKDRASGYVNSPETIGSIEALMSLVESGYAATPQSVEQFGGTTQAFLNDNLAMMTTGPWSMSTFESAGKSFATVMNPQMKQPASVHASAGWAISAYTPHKEEAWKVLKFITGEVGHRIMAETGWALPAVPAVADELGYTSIPTKRAFYHALEYSKLLPGGLLATWQEDVGDFLGEAFQAIMNGTMAVTSALEEAARRIDAALRD